MPNRPVSKVVENRVFVTVPLDLPVSEAAKLMQTQGVAAVLVVEDGRLAGICTERDLVVDVLAAGLDARRTPVSAVMTADPVSVGAEMPFGHALHLMFEGGFRHVPVLNQAGALLGVVSVRDALALDVVRFQEELRMREALAEIL